MFEASKRLVDVAVSVAGLASAFPLMIVIALVVRLACGRGVIFRHERAGKHGRPFTLLKFRTMAHASSQPGREADRITRVGGWLRRMSLDELPQLWNVLKGDMSLVGPRPLPIMYLPRYSSFEARRHEVRPGLTGWAQINGRNAVSWDDRLTMDVWYVDNRSLVLDLQIIMQTVWRVVRMADTATADGKVMEEFRPRG